MNVKEVIGLAAWEATRVYGHKYKHACIIYDKNGVIAKGRNKMKFHPTLRKYGYNRNCWLHAESDAILKCSDVDLKRATLLVIRKSKTKLSNSKPCPACVAMIREKFIRRVVYSDALGNLNVMEMKYADNKPNIDFSKAKVIELK